MSDWIRDLECLGAFCEGLDWARSQPDRQTAWDVCERSDWMVWLLSEVDTSSPWSEGRKPLVSCMMQIVTQVLPLVEREYRPLVYQGHLLVWRWTDYDAPVAVGQSGLDILRTAVHDSFHADTVISFYHAASTAFLTSNVAEAVLTAEEAFDNANAVDAVEASAVLGGPTREVDKLQFLRQSALIVRKHFPVYPIGGVR